MYIFQVKKYSYTRMVNDMNISINKKITFFLIVFLSISLVVLASTNLLVKKEIPKSKQLTGVVLNKQKESLTIKTNANEIYTFKTNQSNKTTQSSISIGDNILIEYTGLLNKNASLQDITILNCLETLEETDSNGIPLSWKDNGIFKDYYLLAKNKLDELTLDEKIGQLLLVKYPSSNGKEALKLYEKLIFWLYFF